MVNVLIVCFGFSGFVLISYFFKEGQLGTASFSTLFVSITLACLALYGFDRLKVFDLKNLMFSLDEIKDVQKDVYAKAELVKRLGEEVAELTAFNVTRVGRFAGPNLKKAMIEARERIKELLESLGSDREKIVRISKQIDDLVLHDLKRDIESEIERTSAQGLTEGKQIDREQVRKKVREVLEKYNRDALVSYLKEQGLYRDEILPLLDNLDKFIQTKTL